MMMCPMDSKDTANYLYNVIKEGEIHQLKLLLKEIQDDYDYPAFDYLQRRCRKASDLEIFLKDYPYLFIVENGRVARYNEELESGQEKADKYFEEKMKAYKGPVNFLMFRRHVDEAPGDIRDFIDSFYPETLFKRYLQKRPNLFIMRRDNTVHLVERESVQFFRRSLQRSNGIGFMSLRGRVGQAPEYIRAYINDLYPGTEFLRFLEEKTDVFEVDCDGTVRLVK